MRTVRFDIAHCSLVLHHAEPAGALRLLQEMARVSRIGVVINDLERSRLAWLGAWLLTRVATRNAYTRHDAPLSVRRAYRPAEVAQMAARAGLVEAARFRDLLRHRYAIAFVPAPRGGASARTGAERPVTERRVDVAIVGGGPAGAATAIGLARAGVEVALFERAHEPKWRACGVYSSPLTRARLAALGLDDERLEALVARVPALVVQTLGGATCRLDYAPSGGACGADRVRLDAELLERAAAAGARGHARSTVREVRPGRRRRTWQRPRAWSSPGPNGGWPQTWRARLVVGADGPGSLVARSFGVQRSARRLRRAGMTFHLDVGDSATRDGHMVIGPAGTAASAPCRAAASTSGSWSASESLRRALARGERPIDVARQILGELPEPWSSLSSRPATDELAIALPLANRVSARSGPGFLLVGDAAGFIDPISGEGLHRALVSAELAVRASAPRS